MGGAHMRYGWGSYALWVGLICVMGGAHMHYGWGYVLWVGLICIMDGAHALWVGLMH